MKNKIMCIVAAAFVSVFSVLCFFAPKEEYSIWERRALTVFPQLSTERVWDGSFMSDFEKYATDSFSFRNGFRRIRSMWDKYIFAKSDVNGLYFHNGYVSKIEYPLNMESVRNAAEKFEAICERYLSEENRVYMSVIPDKNYFMAAEHPRLDYDKMIKYLQENFQEAEYIDIFPLLSLEDYYRTDTHWRQEAICDVAERLCLEMGAEFSGDLIENALEGDFFGVYYGQSALPLESDKIAYLTSNTINNLSVYDYENSRETGVYDMEKANGNDPYEMYLSGPVSLIEINNPNAAENKELVIFRDSFGSAIAPLMAEGYSKITLVDIRYIGSNYIGNFIDFGNADILFLYSTLVLNNSLQFR